VLNSIRTDKLSINMSNLKSGIYFLKFYGKDNSYSTAKFIKN